MPPKHYWRSFQPIRMIHLCGPSPKDPQNYKNLKYLKKNCSFRGGGARGGGGGKRWGVGRPPNIKKFVLMFFFNFLLLSSKILLRFFSGSFWSESEILKKKHKKSLQKKSVEKGAFLAFLGHFWPPSDIFHTYWRLPLRNILFSGLEGCFSPSLAPPHLNKMFLMFSLSAC